MCGCVHLLEILWRALSQIVRGAGFEVGRDACARAIHGRSGVQFFEFLSRIMRGLLAVPFGIR